MRQNLVPKVSSRVVAALDSHEHQWLFVRAAAPSNSSRRAVVEAGVGLGQAAEMVPLMAQQQEQQEQREAVQG
jgi:hypothetical protein